MLYFRALASGSSGNSFLLRTDKTSILFDAGLRLPALQRHLVAESLMPGDLGAVLLSHEHRDHCSSAFEIAQDWKVPVWANADVLRAVGLQESDSASVLDVGTPTLFGDVEITTFPVEHDAVAPVGFLVRTHGRTITVATDLGHATPAVLDAVSSSDLVVLESNHDPDMLHTGKYPVYLRSRVAGPRGHLSNFQAGAALAGAISSPETDVWLAHLSKENNTHEIALRTVRKTLRAAGLINVHVDVASRDRPSLRWHGIKRPRQLSLFDGPATGQWPCT